MTLRLGSLFSGVGGFEQGFEAAGFETAWMVEIDPHAQSILRRHYSGVPLFDNVRSVGAHNLSPVDVVTFGSPCQDLSIAGNRAGIGGARSGLFFEAIRIISELQPRYAIWENVAGALSSNKGRDFGTALDALAEIGAVEIAYRILDAQYFGVPQRRRRVFVVADFGATRSGEVLFEPEGVSGHPAPRPQARQDIAATLGGGSGARGWSSDTDRMTFLPVPMTGTARCLSSRNERYDYETETFVIDAHSTKQGVASALTASAGHHGHSSPRRDGSDNLVVAATFDERNVTSAANRTRCKFGLPAQTLHERGLSVITADSLDLAVRRLTPLECERLMGFPDNWTRYADTGKELSDSHRYRLCGNGVVTNVTRWIAQRMAAVFASEQEGAA